MERVVDGVTRHQPDQGSHTVKIWFDRAAGSANFLNLDDLSREDGLRRCGTVPILAKGRAVLSHVLKGAVVGPDLCDVDEHRAASNRARSSQLCAGCSTSGRTIRLTGSAATVSSSHCPSGVDAHDHPQLEGRSALDLVDATDRQLVIDAWHRVREIGATHTRVSLRSGADATLYFFDLRERHGVLVGALVTESEIGVPTTPLEFTAVPRVSMQRKNDIAVFTDVDEATTLMLGWSREELIGHASLDFVHPDDHDRAIESWMDMLSTSGVHRRAPAPVPARRRIVDVARAHESEPARRSRRSVRRHRGPRRLRGDGCPRGRARPANTSCAESRRRCRSDCCISIATAHVLYANERVNEILGMPKVDDTELAVHERRPRRSRDPRACARAGDDRRRRRRPRGRGRARAGAATTGCATFACEPSTTPTEPSAARSCASRT